MSSNMTPENSLDILVHVQVGDEWHEGWLEHWRRDGDRWTGYVRYTTAPAETRLGWFDQDRIRRVEDQ